MLVLALAAFAIYASPPAQARPTTDPEPGQLTMLKANGQPGALCPLKGTVVDAEVAGFGARVNVMQTFVNPSETPIEAVYTFPLPADAAVDHMRFKIGKRVIEGEIHRREEARRIYEAAKNAGQAAALLDQERPNIFTQSVANIMPGAEVQVEISYVQILKYEDGEFEFMYPMVVGPRFLGNAEDAEKIAPPVTPKGTRSGSNIKLNVHIDAGAPIQSLQSVLHQVNVRKEGDAEATVTIAKRDEIPNRDFILHYRTATDSVQSAFVTNYDGKKGGFFSLILLPPKAPKVEQIAPREMIFVMDQSGSQSGFPIQKSKELTLKLIRTMRKNDTFNVFGFNNTVHALFPAPQPVTESTLARAETFIKAMEANGGTQLLEGLNAAIQPPKDPERLRIVVFNTDGYVGDEPQILDTIVKSRDTTRIFTFGIGNGVNRFLIDSMSLEGRGDSETVTLDADADKAVGRFLQRTRSPILTDVKVRFDGVELHDVTPSAVPDVFSEKPIVLHGRYENPGQGTMVVSGLLGGKPWSKSYPVRFSPDSGNSSVQCLWARKKIDDLQSKSYLNMVKRAPGNDYTNQIIDVALEFGLMTQYTSFVAVEPRIVNVGGRQHTVRVPVEMTDGVSYESQGLDMNGRVMRRIAIVGGSLRAGGPGGMGGGMGGGGVAGSVAAAKAVRGQGQVADEAVLESPLSAQEQEKRRYESVVPKNLRNIKGSVDVMIWLSKTDAVTISKLKAAGFKISEIDGKLMVAFGTCEAANLKPLSKIEAVQRIEKLD